MLSSSANTALTIVFSVLLVVNLVGNSLVCYVVLGHRAMRTPMNYLLVNLAIADMFVATFFAPQYIFRRAFHHPSGKSGDFVCKFLTGGFLTWVGGAASAFTLVSIAFERYYAVVHSRLERRQITKKKVKGLILACWIYAFTVELSPVIVMKYNHTIDACYEDWPSITYPRVYTMITFFLDFALPSLIMAYLHAQTIRVLRIETRNLAKTGGTQFATLKSEKRITIMVVLVTVIYSICWLPDVTSYLLAYYVTGFQYGSLLYHTATVFVCVNSCVNPFIYSIQNKRFRRHLKSLVLCGRSSNLVTDISQNTAVSGSIGRKEKPQQNVIRRRKDNDVGITCTTNPGHESEIVGQISVQRC